MRSILLFIFILCGFLTVNAQEKPQIKSTGFGKITSRRVQSSSRSLVLRSSIDTTNIDASKEFMSDQGIPGLKKKIKAKSKAKIIDSEVPLAIATEGVTGTNSWLTNEPPVMVPPSPTAASLINQSKESVDLYTGRVNITLPLYTLKTPDIEVPIQLSYNTSGVKVDDVASWVGMSWALDPADQSPE